MITCLRFDELLTLKKNVLIDFRERRGEQRERELLFHLFMHSLVNSCVCPDWRLDLQNWYIGVMLPGQSELPALDIFLTTNNNLQFTS